MKKEVSTGLENIFSGKFNNFIVIFFCMAYITIKLVCNLLFLRPVEISLLGFPEVINVPSASFLYPIIYILNINILMLSNRRIAIIVALVGILCDGIFSFGCGYITKLEIPHQMSVSELHNTLAINVFGGYLWNFYYKGIFISIIVAILNLELFLFCKKINIPLFLAIIISTFIPTIIHQIEIFGVHSGEDNSLFANSIVYSAVLIFYTMINVSIKRTIENYDRA